MRVVAMEQVSVRWSEPINEEDTLEAAVQSCLRRAKESKAARSSYVIEVRDPDTADVTRLELTVVQSKVVYELEGETIQDILRQLGEDLG